MASESLLMMAEDHIRDRGSVARSYAVVLIAALVLYVLSCAPDVLWQDSGMIQYRVLNNDIEGKLGLALSHPLFYVLAIGAKYIPAGEIFYRINLVSAVAAAIAVANLYLLVRLWLGEVLPAIIGAATLAFSHTFWRHGSIIETYTLYIALFLAGLIMLLQYVRTERAGYLYGLALFNGLALSVHMFASLPFVCYVVFVLYLLVNKRIGAKHLGIAAVCWLIGAGLYLFLILKTMVQSGEVGATLASAVFGHRYRGDVLNSSLSLRIVKENLMYIALNFPTPNILLFFLGCYGISKVSGQRSFKGVLLALTVLFFLFAFRYTVVDRYAFFIPFYCLASVLIGLGAHFLFTATKRKGLMCLLLILAFMPIGAYAAAPAMAKRAGLNMGLKREIPHRDDYKYFLQPWKTGYDGARRFADESFELIEPNGAVYADSTTVFPLLCVQRIRGKHSDVRIFSYDWIDYATPLDEHLGAEYVAGAGLYVVSPVKHYCPDYLLDHYDFLPAGVLWKVAERR